MFSRNYLHRRFLYCLILCPVRRTLITEKILFEDPFGLYANLRCEFSNFGNVIWLAVCVGTAALCVGEERWRRPIIWKLASRSNRAESFFFSPTLSFLESQVFPVGQRSSNRPRSPPFQPAGNVQHEPQSDQTAVASYAANLRQANCPDDGDGCQQRDQH